MRTCEEYEALISALLDGALADEDRAELMAHMAECPVCQAYFDDQIAIRTALAGMEVQAPEGFADRVMAQVRQESRQTPVSQKQEKKTVPFPLWRRYAAMAACCAIVAIAGFWAFNDSQLGTGNVAADTALMDSRSAPVAEDQESDAADSSAPADAVVADAAGDAPLSDEQPVGEVPADSSVPEVDVEMTEEQSAEEPESFSITTADSGVNGAGSTGSQEDPRPETYDVRETDAPKTCAVTDTVMLTTNSALAEAWVTENLGRAWEPGTSYTLTVEQFDQIQVLLQTNGEEFVLARPLGGETLADSGADDSLTEEPEVEDVPEEDAGEYIPAESESLPEEEPAAVVYVLQAAP